MTEATRVVYSDLDGTMVGPGGCFWRDESYGITDEPARVLHELLASDVALVLVSGRTREQLVEAGRIFGADGFVAELGALVGWDRGRSSELLPSAAPPGVTRAPDDLVAELLDRCAGRLEHHSPWHIGHSVDVMLRGNVDVADTEQWLSAQGFGWLRLRDNGVLPPPNRSKTLADGVSPVHVYHLMPDGLSKGLAVAWDLARRGLSAEQAIAIGDSTSDLEMAGHVGRFFLTANGARHEHLADAPARFPNVTVTRGAVGLGWAEAVSTALA